MALLSHHITILELYSTLLLCLALCLSMSLHLYLARAFHVRMDHIVVNTLLVQCCQQWLTMLADSTSAIQIVTFVDVYSLIQMTLNRTPLQSAYLINSIYALIQAGLSERSQRIDCADCKMLPYITYQNSLYSTELVFFAYLSSLYIHELHCGLFRFLFSVKMCRLCLTAFLQCTELRLLRVISSFMPKSFSCCA